MIGGFRISRTGVDPLLFLLPLVLAGIGVTIIYGLTADQQGFSLWLRQLLFVFVGVILGGALWLTDYRTLFANHLWILTSVLGLLALTLVIGEVIFGARSWIDLGIFTFQASEFAKLSFLLSMGSVLFGTRDTVISWGRLGAALTIALLLISLILLQPDFGTVTVYLIITLVLFMVAPLSHVQRVFLLLAVGAVCALGLLAYRSVPPFDGLLRDYQRNRIANVLGGGEGQERGSAYNVDQAVVAIGSGGLLGKGIGYGTQSQLSFLPVVHSDFIVAAIGEAWGFVGMVLLIGAFTVLIWRLLVLTFRVRDPAARAFVLGFAVLLFYQMVVSVGMNMELMPVTGIPLPFVSSGGTAVITYFMICGVVLSIATRAAVDREPQTW